MDSYFSSDYHLGHANVIKYDKRPFKDVSEMNESIIRTHNEIVSIDDNFYFMGDFSFDNRNTEEWLLRLNGNKFFVKGNHDKDKTIKLYEKYGTYLGGLGEITVQGQAITLVHYGMRVWNKSHRGSWCLYGHSHGSLPDDPNSLSFDVGIMLHEYKPINFERVKKIMSKKTWKPVDHHGTREDDKKRT